MLTSLSGRRLIRAIKRWQKSTFCFPGSTPAIFTKTSNASGSVQLASIISRIFRVNSMESMGSLSVIISCRWVEGGGRGFACLGEGDRSRF